MKVVISTDLYYPMINGVAVFSRNLAMGLARRGHEVIVLAPSVTGKFMMETDEEGGFRVARLSSIKFPFYPDQIEKIPEAKAIFGLKLPRILYKNGLHVSFYAYPEIKKVLDEFQPDLIHDQTPGPVALAVYRYANKRDVPLVATGHAYPDNFTGQIKFLGVAKKPIDAVVRKYFASFLLKAEHATMPTELAIDELMPKKRRNFKVKVEALSNGIDLSRFSAGGADDSIYAKYDIPTDRPVVLYVGRVDPEKSLGVLVRAFARVLDSMDATLVVVGDGSDKGKLEKLAKELEIEQSARFLGRIVGDDLPALYRTGDVFVITSTTETQSIVLMEAMASGLPAVAVRAGAVGELVKNNKNGYLCKPGDEVAVARSIVKMLKNPDVAYSFGKMSLEMVKKHDVGHTMDRIEAIYTGVLERRAGG